MPGAAVARAGAIGVSVFCGQRIEIRDLGQSGVVLVVMTPANPQQVAGRCLDSTQVTEGPEPIMFENYGAKRP